MYRIATNESLNFLKLKAKKYFQSSEEMMTKLAENLKEDPYFDGDALQLKLQLLIANLPKKQKLVFQMKYEQNMKFKDISEILGTSVGALKASYHLAVKKIRIEITKNQTF
jgi:RNA polymerase sigma-70 factor (ECF subfamily)